MNIEYSNVFFRLMSRLGVETDAQMAHELGVSPQTLSTWKRRGTIPYEKIIGLCIRNGYSLDEVLSGQRTSGAINQVLVHKVIKILRSEKSELRDVKLDSLLDTVIMMYNSTYKLEDEEADLVLEAQLKALNLSAVSNLAQEWAKHAITHRQDFIDNPQLAEAIPTPFKTVVKAILKDEKYELPSEPLDCESQKLKKENLVNQNIKGTNHTIAGGDISINKQDK